MLEKIQKSLSGEGMFVGSESLRREGHDHLQFPFRTYRVVHYTTNFIPALNDVRSFGDQA